MDADLEAHKCATDMVDSALESLDLTLSKRSLVGFASGFFIDYSNYNSNGEVGPFLCKSLYGVKFPKD